MKNLKRIKKYVLLIFVSISLASCGTIKLEPGNCIGTCADGIANYEKTGSHKITLERSRNLYNNYNEKIKPAIKTVQEFNIERTVTIGEEYQPTDFVIIKKEVLECYLKFLKEVEQKNKEAGSAHSEITGVAVFLGANGPNELLINKTSAFNDQMRKERQAMRNARTRESDTLPVPLDEDIRGRLTMFLAPTYYDSIAEESLSEEQRHVPFFIKADNANEPYVGEYSNLLVKFHQMNMNAISRSSNRSASGSGTDTSLNLDEFTQMPPKKPKGVQ
ncbi:hypothetical protein [Maribacter sp. 2308TA10-17]|uniref:hypothetical protein n=1 Tax=Maribacter sp. 2308TA10-17 TaxID=3386276 RepID=UPI0039BD832E